MAWEDDIRRIVREEIRAALADVRGMSPSTSEPDLVALGEVRRWVQVSRSTLKRWIADGALPKFGHGRVVRVRLADVRGVLERRAGAVRPATEAAPNLSTDARRILSAVKGGRG